MIQYGVTNLIMKSMEKQFKKECRRDKNGDYYLTYNRVLRVCAVILVLISVLIFAFMGFYAEESFYLAVFLGAASVVNFFVGLRLWLMKATLQDEGLYVGSFFKKFYTYGSLAEAARARTPLLRPKLIVFIPLPNKGCRKINLEMFYGGLEFLGRLEERLDYKFEDAKTSEPFNAVRKIIGVLVLVALGVVIFNLGK